MSTEAVAARTSVSRISQVRIHLHPRDQDEEIRVPDTGAILVSTEFRRYQLSTLVNRLLETQKPLPFEFLISGQFLRTSLDDFLTQHGISAETTLEVEYVKALIPPLLATSYEHDDWVSSVDVLSQSSKAAYRGQDQSTEFLHERIISGSYDGLLNVWNTSSEVVATGHAHTAAVKAVKCLSPSKVVSGAIDRTVRLWKFDNSKSSLTSTLALVGHKSSIDNIAVDAPSSRILSASSDHSIGLWSTKKNDAPAAPENLLHFSNKRRKLSDASSQPAQRGALAFLSGHVGQVSDVCFDDRDSSVAYSSSWDHSIKTWDLATAKCVDTRSTAQSLLSVLHLPDSGLIATGTSARHITLVDPRASATQISALTLRGHTNAVVSLAADPHDQASHKLISGSHDGTCRIWDLRSVQQDAGSRVTEAVYVIERESAKSRPKAGVPGDGVKVFGVCWNKDVGILSCGEDKKVQINRASS